MEETVRRRLRALLQEHADAWNKMSEQCDDLSLSASPATRSRLQAMASSCRGHSRELLLLLLSDQGLL